MEALLSRVVKSRIRISLSAISLLRRSFLASEIGMPTSSINGQLLLMMFTMSQKLIPPLRCSVLLKAACNSLYSFFVMMLHSLLRMSSKFIPLFLIQIIIYYSNNIMFLDPCDHLNLKLKVFSINITIFKEQTQISINRKQKSLCRKIYSRTNIDGRTKGNSQLQLCCRDQYMYSDKMNENKMERISHIKEIMTNYFSNQLRTQKVRSSNIITHQPSPNFSTIINQNPEEPIMLFSARKSIPKNTEVMHERSEMIVHPSKISKDVPGWFKGETYKYYSRNEFDQLHKQQISRTIEDSRNLIGVYQQNRSNRSEVGTPRSQRSSDDGNFYFGGGQREYIRRASLRKPTRQISGKIGSTDIRNFELPKIPLKVGKEEYINTHRAF